MDAPLLAEAARSAAIADARRGQRMAAGTATFFAILGHSFLGFEQSLAQVGAALIAAYSTALACEWVDARANDRRPGYAGGADAMVTFLTGAHMTAITMSFLLYVSDSLMSMAFAVSAGIASKYFFRVRVGDRYRHFMNPSNFGIVAAFVLFPSFGIIPYEFTENFWGWSGLGDWILPGIIIVLGSTLNARFTHRMPLVASFLVGFAAQAVIRALIAGTSIAAGLNMMTGIAFILFAFYMITDPMTSPSKPRSQVIFGLSTAFVYGLLMWGDVIFTLFYAVVIVCALRGLILWVDDRRTATA